MLKRETITEHDRTCRLSKQLRTLNIRDRAGWGEGVMPVTRSIGEPIHETAAGEAHVVISARVRGVLRDTVCGPSAKAGSLGLSHRHFLFQGDDVGVGSLRTVELLVRHAMRKRLRRHSDSGSQKAAPTRFCAPVDGYGGPRSTHAVRIKPRPRAPLVCRCLPISTEVSNSRLDALNV